MNQLQIFENPEFGAVRTVEIDGEPWLVGKDVAQALGYSNPSKAIMVHVDDEDKRFEMIRVSDSQMGIWSKQPSSTNPAYIPWCCHPNSRRPANSNTGSRQRFCPASAGMACTRPMNC